MMSRYWPYSSNKAQVKLRRREPDEDLNPTKLRRSHTSNICHSCHKYRHNSRSYRNKPIHEQSKEGGT